MPTSAGEPDKPPRLDLKGVRVLVVEDHWHVANALKLFLEIEGMEVSGPAATTADARRLAAVQKPDIAVIDINLKGEMAHALIDQLHDQGVPIVVVSGYAVLPGLTDKVVAVLQKPFNAPELLAAFRRVLSLTLKVGRAVPWTRLGTRFMAEHGQRNQVPRNIAARRRRPWSCPNWGRGSPAVSIVWRVGFRTNTRPGPAVATHRAD